MRTRMLLALFSLLFPAAIFACSYCEAGFGRKTTLREEALVADCVLDGTAGNARMVGRDEGATDFRVASAVKINDGLSIPACLTLPRYIRIDEKAENRFLLFCKFRNGSFDAYRGQAVGGPETAVYLRKALAKSPKDRAAQLAFFADNLDSADEVIAADAFLELAKAGDAEMRLLGNALAAERLRKLIASPKTPPERLSLFCYLLGRAGQSADFAFLKNGLERHPEQYRPAMAGVLGGMIELSPAEGWAYLRARATRKENSHAEQLAVLNALRFFKAARPDDLNGQILPIMKALFDRGDFADLIVEDWRQWKVGVYSAEIAAQYGNSTHAAPLIKRAIIRYALTIDDSSCRQLIAAVRRSDAELVDDIRKALE